MKINTIVSFYKFIQIQSPESKREPILAKARELEIFGTIILAEEGVNGMLSGSPGNL